MLSKETHNTTLTGRYAIKPRSAGYFCIGYNAVLLAANDFAICSLPSQERPVIFDISG